MVERAILLRFDGVRGVVRGVELYRNHEVGRDDFGLANAVHDVPQEMEWIRGC